MIVVVFGGFRVNLLFLCNFDSKWLKINFSKFTTYTLGQIDLPKSELPIKSLGYHSVGHPVALLLFSGPSKKSLNLSENSGLNLIGHFCINAAFDLIWVGQCKVRISAEKKLKFPTVCIKRRLLTF